MDTVIEHYNAAADSYTDQYEKENLENLDILYPANYFRMNLMINTFLEHNIKRVIEVGVGEGTPLVNLSKTGIETWGFDFAESMVKRSQENFAKNKLPANRIFWGDICDPSSYVHCLQEGLFDGLMAMGVMPHVKNDKAVLKNMSTLIKPGGTVFIEFRNKLFSLFTFNRHTYNFIMDDLLDGVDPKLKDSVGTNIKKHLLMDEPKFRTNDMGDGEGPHFDEIYAKFHNPFEVMDQFKELGFTDIKPIWYHYHPAPPFMEKEQHLLFRREQVNLEYEQSGWKGLFLCSAFVIQARKAE